MNGIDMFLTHYGLLAIFGIMLALYTANQLRAFTSDRPLL